MERESDMTPSIAEKNSIVESYLKCQQAWEQVTDILPWELVVTMRFFGDVEKQATTFINTIPHGNSICTIELHQYHLSCLAEGQDILAKGRECCLKCQNLWRQIEMVLQSEGIKRLTTISGDAGGCPRRSKAQCSTAPPSAIQHTK
jgi:hypothetical protein